MALAGACPFVAQGLALEQQKLTSRIHGSHSQICAVNRGKICSAHPGTCFTRGSKHTHGPQFYSTKSVRDGSATRLRVRSSRNDNGNIHEEVDPLFDVSQGDLSEGEEEQLGEEEIPGDIQKQEVARAKFGKGWKGLSWLLGPCLMLLAVVVPPAVIRPVVQKFLGDSFVAGLSCLLLLDLSFLLSVILFLRLLHTNGTHTRTPRSHPSDSSWRFPWLQDGQPPGMLMWHRGLRLALLMLPVLALATAGPAGSRTEAAAVFFPVFFVVVAEGLVEGLEWLGTSPAWPVAGLLIQLYRLQQLNRGSMLLSGQLSALAASNEALSEGMLAYGSSLNTQLSLVQVLGLLTVFSLAARLSLLPWMYSTWNSVTDSTPGEESPVAEEEKGHSETRVHSEGETPYAATA